MMSKYSVFFFFQAEDGIRDLTVTGVQTCALPILFGNGTGSCNYTTYSKDSTLYSALRSNIKLLSWKTMGSTFSSYFSRSEEHTSELQSQSNLVCRLLLEKKNQVYAQNEMLAYQQKESTARVASIMENTNLSKQQQVSEIMRQMLTQAQTAGQYFTNDQIKEMTRKVSAEVDLVHQQTQNQRYGSSHIGATAKDISN